MIIASAPWKTAGPLNCHHIATRLAAENRVLFVESTGLRTPNPLSGADLRKICRRVRGWLQCRVSGTWKARENLSVLSPIGLPLHEWPLLERWNAAMLARACGKAERRLHFRRPILWAFLPWAERLVGRLDESAVIYHCVDNYSGNPGVNAAEIERQERRIAAAADVCFATSRPLAERLAAMGGDVRCVPNVADFEHFSAAREIPAEFSGIPRPIVGYMGNLAAYKVDLEILAEIAVRRPEWSLVVIGPVNGGYRGGGIGRLRALRNVRLFGPKRYEEIPAYLRGLDVGLIPFRRNRVTDYSLPLKVFEYLAAGRPVVSSPLLSLTAEPLEDVVHYASTGEEFVAAIERSLAEDGPAQAQMRREVAARYSWEKRFPEIIAQVEEVLEGKEAACRG